MGRHRVQDVFFKLADGTSSFTRDDIFAEKDFDGELKGRGVIPQKLA